MNPHNIGTKTIVRYSIVTVFFCSIFPLSFVSADFLPPTPSAYSFGPEGGAFEDMQSYGKPTDMMSILPNHPIAAHDKYGNKQYYSATGDMIVQIAPDGTQKFSVGGKTITRDENGKIISTSELITGTNRVEIKNEKGQITGYQEMGLNNMVMQEYDAQGNLTKTYVYDTYGKKVQSIVDELSLTKTVFNNYGDAQYDQNFEGAIVARYTYDKEHRLQSKTDLYGNITFFDKKGNLTNTVDNTGNKLTQYYYKTDDDGRYVLDRMEDVSPGATQGDVTYFTNGLAQVVKSRFGGVAQEYHYDGHILQYTFNTRTNETTWYDLNGKMTKNTFNESVTKEWLYYQSRLVGYYDHNQQTVVLYQFERQDQAVKIYAQNNVPTADDIEKYYEQSGLMTDVGVSEITPSAGRKDIVRKSNISATVAKQRSLRKFDYVFDAVMDGKADVTLQKKELVQVKYNYSATGKLDNIVSRNPDDATGWTTEFHLGDTVITVSGDQRNNQYLAMRLATAVIDGNQNISTIADSTDPLVAFAQSVKSVTFQYDKLSTMSDQQICNAFGWNINGATTKTCIADVRARSANAGENGTVTVTFGYSGNSIYAAAVTGTDSNAYIVGGLQQSKLLDLSSAQASAGVLVAANQTNTASPATNSTAATGNTSYSSTDRVQTVNGVTRTYAENGNILLEVDALTGEKRVFDSLGRRDKVYSGDGILQKSYKYADDGSLQSTCSLITDQTSGQPSYVTTFFVGWGAAEVDQPAITVQGDQTANAALAAKLWHAITSGTNLSDISSGAQSSELSSFAQTIRAISANPNLFRHMDDQRIGDILGLGTAGLTAAADYQTLRNWAASTGSEGTFTISYASESKEGRTWIYATQIQIYHGTQPTTTLSLNSMGMEFSAALDTLLQRTGLTSLSNSAAALVSPQ